MAKYKWSFANVGGVTRVRIQSAEDIRHLGELDKKMWTVLSCPVNGLEISSDSLSLMDVDGDGKLRLKEVIATGSLRRTTSARLSKTRRRSSSRKTSWLSIISPMRQSKR